MADNARIRGNFKEVIQKYSTDCKGSQSDMPSENVMDIVRERATLHQVRMLQSNVVNSTKNIPYL